MADINSVSRARRYKYGINAFVLAISVVGIVFVLNAILSKYSKQYDLTKNKNFSLSSQTVRMIEKLDKQVTIFIFAKEGDAKNEMLEDILKQYSRRSKFIKVMYIDLDKNPSLAGKFKVTKLGTIVFSCGDSNVQIDQNDLYDFGVGMAGHGKTSEFDGEKVITSNIIMVSNKTRKKIYSLVGHGERLVSNMEESGLAILQDYLIKENYDVISINLSKNPDIPANDTILMIPGPKYPFPEREIKTIDEYLEKGGKVFLMIDPKVASFNGLDKLLEKWGVILAEDLVIEPASSYFFDPLTPIPIYVPHKITDELIKEKNHAVFPGARTVSKSEKTPDNLEISPLLKTSPKSWAEKDFKNQEAVLEESDVKGPLTLAMAVEKIIKKTEVTDTTRTDTALYESDNVEEKKTGGRLAVVGDSDFASNRMTNTRGNVDFFMNIVNWLAGDRDKISIRPIILEYVKINLSKNQSKAVLVISLAFIPVLIAGIGGIIWWKRRSL